MKLTPRLFYSCLLVMLVGTLSYAQVVEQGKKVKFEYKLTVDGNVIDSSEGREPIQFVQGDATIIPGLSKQLEGMKAGEEKHVVVSPEEGYGIPDPKAFKEVEKSILSTEQQFEVGQIFEFYAEEGQSFPGVISEIKDKTVMVNFNHPLAGKELIFDVKIVSIE